jgi:hypothetical protein
LSSDRLLSRSHSGRNILTYTHLFDGRIELRDVCFRNAGTEPRICENVGSSDRLRLGR